MKTKRLAHFLDTKIDWILFEGGYVYFFGIPLIIYSLYTGINHQIHLKSFEYLKPTSITIFKIFHYEIFYLHWEAYGLAILTFILMVYKFYEKHRSKNKEAN